ncbi:hypothetical protein BDN72DRAFT_861071 [Pluteus cervinus]|uniref:Uncharacterized protein n=1 Tax=Pluteus cervinus TaxID=181527 RepID=A0ACD3AG51_9AGAR|nr:hypothetical protein BDN72DRAFT_861071 [Pluteus cervinus]
MWTYEVDHMLALLAMSPSGVTALSRTRVFSDIFTLLLTDYELGQMRVRFELESSGMSLDEDVIDLITGILHGRGDHEALRNVCRVSRTFRDPAQRRIFSDIKLQNHLQNGTPQWPRLQFLLSLFIANPILVTHIRTVHITQLQLMRDAHGNDVTPVWVVDDSDVLALLLQPLCTTQGCATQHTFETKSTEIIAPKLSALEWIFFLILDEAPSTWKINLSHCRDLRRLSLHHTFSGELDEFVAWMANTLQTIPNSHPTLHSIILGSDFQPGYGDYQHDLQRPSLRLLQLTHHSNVPGGCTVCVGFGVAQLCAAGERAEPLDSGLEYLTKHKLFPNIKTQGLGYELQ